jgi:hypothetical protein
MKKKINKIRLVSGILLILSIIVFYCLSDINKAKISLRLLGVHKENASEFSAIKNMILNNQFSYCKERDNIPPQIVELIEKYNSETYSFQNSISKSTLSDIYAIEGEKWNSSCQPSSDLPSMKFEELYYNDNALIIGFLSGGIGVSGNYEFFDINTDTLSLIGGVSYFPGLDMFIFAVSLKTDGGMFEYTKVESPLVQNKE